MRVVCVCVCVERGGGVQGEGVSRYKEVST